MTVDITVNPTDLFHVKSCPLCRETNFLPLFNLPRVIKTKRYIVNYPFPILLNECTNCGLFFKQHILSDKVEKLIYGTYSQVSSGRWGSGDQLPKYISSSLNLHDYVLEVGPGETSSFPSDRVRHYSIVVANPDEGIPSNADEVFLGSLGSELLQESQLSNRLFDKIILLDVFEHLSTIGENLEQLISLLSPAGSLFIETGNSSSKAATLLRERWWYYNIPEHKVFLNPSVIRYLDRKLQHYSIQSCVIYHKSNHHMIDRVYNFLLSTYKKLFMSIQGFTANLLPHTSNLIAPPPTKDHLLLRITKH